MDIKALLQRENDRVKDYIVRSCQDLTDEQVRFGHEAVDERGITGVVVHLYNSLERRAATVAEREAPGEPDPLPQTIADLLAFADATHRRTATLIDQISEQRLESKVVLPPSREMTGIEAMMQGFTHSARHVGNILDLRHLGGFETHALG